MTENSSVADSAATADDADTDSDMWLDQERREHFAELVQGQINWDAWLDNVKLGLLQDCRFCRHVVRTLKSRRLTLEAHGNLNPSFRDLMWPDMAELMLLEPGDHHQQ